MKTRKLSVYSLESEVRMYIAIVGAATLIVAITLAIYHEFHFGKTLLNALFTVVSLATTTGFTTTNFSVWPTFLPYMVMFVAIIGGCGGSTAGGIKVMRFLVLKEQGHRELKRLIHPQSVMALRFGEQVLPENVIQAIWGFVAMFVVLFVVLLLMLLATGLPIKTAFGALSACMSNTGAGIGGVAGNFEHIPAVSKWILTFSMLAGRLEIFTVLVLFMPAYWRR